MIEERDGRYRVIARWRGYPYICETVGSRKADAHAYHQTLRDLRDAGRRDILSAVAAKEVPLPVVHQMVLNRGARNVALKDLTPGSGDGPLVGDLYDEWMKWLGRPGTTSPRTHRAFSRGTIDRYTDSWDALFLVLGKRQVPLAKLNAAFLAEFADGRIADGAAPATINRDYTAVESFCRWLADHRPEIEFKRPKLTQRQEPKYDELTRHLEPDETTRVRHHCQAKWWPLFELLSLTGLRITEMQYLLRGDVDLDRGELKVVDRAINHLKSRTSERTVPLSPRAAALLESFISARRGSRTDFVFPEELRNYDSAHGVFERACIEAGLHDDGAGHKNEIALLEERIRAARKAKQAPDDEDVARLKELQARPAQIRATRSLHSLRHTFGVACARAQLHPTVIRDLLGHSTISTTERYMRYAASPEESQRHARAVERALAGQAPRPRKVTPRLPQADRRPATRGRSRKRV
jgi:integrase